MQKLIGQLDVKNLAMLHFAPEPFLKRIFKVQFKRYETADLVMRGVDHNVDLRDLPFPNGGYDIVYASHVLEHIKEDGRAISEVRRILTKGGVAILPVPIVADQTIEYLEPNPNESYHVRAPGFDYFDRYRRHFSRVDLLKSEAFPSKYQVFIYEDRTRWPTKQCPLRPAMIGERHVDIVPLCYA